MKSRSLVAAFLCLASSAALAQDRQIGTIVVSDGGTGSNVNTNYGSANCADPVCGPFAITSSSPISMQCNSGAVVAVARATNDAGIGVEVSALQFFLTLSGPNLTVTRPDGGSYTGAVVSVSQATGAAASNRTACKVFVRKGTE